MAILGRVLVEERRGHIHRGVEREVQVQPGVVGRAGGRVLGIGAGGVVALAGDLPAHLVPHLVQVCAGWR